MRATRLLGVLVVSTLAGTGCAYAPNPQSGTLKCSVETHQCPDGYTCDGQYCLKNGHVDGGHADTPKVDAEGLVGRWVYKTGSNENVTCTDGSNKNNDLANDYVDVAFNASVLTASYFCDWNLNLVAGSTVIRPGQSCSRNVTDPMSSAVTKFTWHGTTFTFSSEDGRTATLAAMIAVEYVNDATKTTCATTNSCMGTCTIKIIGTLAKSP